MNKLSSGTTQCQALRQTGMKISAKDIPSNLKPAPDFLGCQASLKQQGEYLVTTKASEVCI